MGDIYHISIPSVLFEAIIKTEQVIRTVPKMEKFISKIYKLMEKFGMIQNHQKLPYNVKQKGNYFQKMHGKLREALDLGKKLGESYCHICQVLEIEDYEQKKVFKKLQKLKKKNCQTQVN